MNKILIAFTFLFISTQTLCFADDPEQVITLKDGSQIKGTLSGISDGVYTVKTPIIGDVHVAASDVASITNGNVAPVAMPANTVSALPTSNQTTGGSPMDQQIATTQQQLMADPQSMQILMQMAQNPEIAQALQDPSLQQAVANHDYSAISSSPAVQKMLADPQMQGLLQKLAAERQQQSGTPSQ